MHLDRQEFIMLCLLPQSFLLAPDWYWEWICCAALFTIINSYLTIAIFSHFQYFFFGGKRLRSPFSLMINPIMMVERRISAVVKQIKDSGAINNTNGSDGSSSELA